MTMQKERESTFIVPFSKTTIKSLFLPPAKSRTFRWSPNLITRPRKKDKDKNSLE